MNNASVDEYYEKYYNLLHKSSKLGFFNTLMHKKMESPHRLKSFNEVLELGCGNFEHTFFVSHNFRNYTATDIRPIKDEDLQKLRMWAHSKKTSKADFIKCDAQKLPFEDNKFDRIVAGCLLLHIQDVDAVISESIRVLKPDGILEMLVPCEGGIFLRIFRRIFSERFAKKMGIPIELYRYVNSIDHVNSFERVSVLTRSSLKGLGSLRIMYFPIRFLPSWYLNIFTVFQIRKQNVYVQ